MAALLASVSRRKPEKKEKGRMAQREGRGTGRVGERDDVWDWTMRVLEALVV